MRPVVPLTLLALTAAVQACAMDPTREGAPSEATGSIAEAIVAGNFINTPVNPVAFRFPASTVRVASASGWCTGTILGPTKVITAAHCVHPNMSVYQYNVYADTTALGSPNQIAMAIPVMANPATLVTSGSTFADLAVLTLTTPLPSTFTPIALAAPGSYVPPVGRSAWAVGVGNHDGKYNGPNFPMKWAPTTPVSPDDRLGYITTKEIVTNEGDSGGPLFQELDDGRLYLVGVLSGSAAGADTYTSVALLANWQWVWNAHLPLRAPIIPSRGAVASDLLREASANRAVTPEGDSPFVELNGNTASTDRGPAEAL